MLARTSKYLRSREYIDDLVEEFNQKNVIFTVTAGRSGSATLSQIFRDVPNVRSLHEPQPQYRYILESVQGDVSLARDFFLFVKVPSILSYPETGYLETSHLYSKGFVEPTLALGFRPSLVFLKRDLRSNAISHLKKNAVPGRTVEGKQYLVKPTANSYVRLDNSVSLTDYQLCYWYCLEIEHRKLLYRELFEDRGLVCVDVEVGELGDKSVVTSLAKELKLVRDGERVSLPNVGTIHNALPRKDGKTLEIDFDQVERLLRSRILLFATKSDVINRMVENHVD